MTQEKIDDAIWLEYAFDLYIGYVPGDEIVQIFGKRLVEQLCLFKR